MNRHEFANWVSALQTYYPRYNLLPNPEAITLWYGELGDIPYDLLSAALRKWVNTEKWPPTIGELRALCAEIVQGKTPDWGEAWKEVMRAVGRYGYQQKEKAYALMSPITQKAVDKLGWYDINMSENPDTIRAQFRQVFEICARREAEDRQLPPALKDTIRQITEKNIPLLEKGADKHERNL